MSATRTQGMNWIRPAKRLAIYLRDGLAGVWCGLSIEDGAKLTLDHLKPYSKGGSHESTNLVTCCHRCNSSRGNRGMKAFATVVANYINHGAKAESILAFVNLTRRRKLDVGAAKLIIEQRGSFVAACRS